jgi:hypothetical protein
MHIDQNSQPNLPEPAQDVAGGYFDLAHFGELARLPIEQFGAQEGRAFLLHHGPIAQPTKGIALDRTIERQPERTAPTAGAIAVDYAVLPIHKTARSPETPLITVGRGANNDVVVPDVSVSQVHAFFEPLQDGRIGLKDVGSLNGTQVNEQRLARHVLTPVPPGAQVYIGAVKFTLMYAKEFCALVQRLVH